VSEWLDASATPANVAWARDAYGAMAPHFTAGRYVNYLNADEVGEDTAIAAAFGPNGKRLREVKRKYDPDNAFHLNQNIKP
jgi:FAD/FMN-containing dehydrogenase